MNGEYLAWIDWEGNEVHVCPFGHLSFGFDSDFVIRISDFRRNRVGSIGVHPWREPPVRQGYQIMLRALALETSGRVGSIAITEDGRLIAEDIFSHGLKHAAEMVPKIDTLLKAAGWQPPDLREIHVSIGPGSFTGLRIGITLAKTLAFATGAKLVAVPSVLILANNAPPEARDVVIVLDAKRDQIFTARLHRDDASADWTIAEAAHLDSLPDMLARGPRPVYLIGEGIPFHEKFIPKNDASIIITPTESWRGRASVVAEIGARMAQAAEYIQPQALLPLYIRKPEAEEKFEAKLAVVAGQNTKDSV
jgi:tRNA threonylcarbamoyladenosine biosynthesis protein TsaB